MMGFEVSRPIGMRVTAHDLTEDDLLVLHTDMGLWYLSVAMEPYLQLDPEFGGSALNYVHEAPFLDMSYLTDSGIPDLRSWFKEMKVDGKLIYRYGMWPQLVDPYITTTTRQAERVKQDLQS